MAVSRRCSPYWRTTEAVYINRLSRLLAQGYMKEAADLPTRISLGRCWGQQFVHGVKINRTTGEPRWKTMEDK
jgi:hypothetical protein